MKIKTYLHLKKIVKEELNKKALKENSSFEKNIQDLEEAEILLQQVVELIAYGVRGTNQEKHARAYIIPHLEAYLSSNSPEISISEYIEYLKGGDLEEANVTGTGASFNPGQGGQYATPKAFKKKINKKTT